MGLREEHFMKSLMKLGEGHEWGEGDRERLVDMGNGHRNGQGALLFPTATLPQSSH